MTTLTLPNGLRVVIDPQRVRQILGVGNARIYLTTGIDVPVRESREVALERITRPKRS